MGAGESVLADARVLVDLIQTGSMVMAGIGVTFVHVYGTVTA